MPCMLQTRQVMTEATSKVLEDAPGLVLHKPVQGDDAGPICMSCKNAWS